METREHPVCTPGWVAQLLQLAFPGKALSQLAFPREGNPNFPQEKSYWDNTVIKSGGGYVLIRDFACECELSEHLLFLFCFKSVLLWMKICVCTLVSDVCGISVILLFLCVCAL